mmetsp:Transcript_69529/g.185082  ORF Transcript_69529/g.185082 Transcript_69529/m.185082 type:complete len:87 (-) Transcript_69529:1025-1285(-)
MLREKEQGRMPHRQQHRQQKETQDEEIGGAQLTREGHMRLQSSRMTIRVQMERTGPSENATELQLRTTVERAHWQEILSLTRSRPT